MDTTEGAVNWEEGKGNLKLKFTSLTDNDLVVEAGRNEEILAKLQNKLGISKDEVIKIIAAF